MTDTRNRPALLRCLPAACVALMLAPVPAVADSDLVDRYIAASQKSAQSMLDVLKTCAPQVDFSSVNFDFTPKMREGVECVIDAHIEQTNRAETVALVEEAEAMADAGFDSMREMISLQEQYPRLGNDRMMGINQSCGTIEASREQPLYQVVQNNMAALTPCFAE